MVRLGIAATIGLVGIVIAGVLGEVTTLPTGVVIAAGAVSALSTAYGGKRALETLIAKIPPAVHDEIVYYGNGAVAALEVVQFAALNMPLWLHAALGALVPLAVLFGIRVGVTPLSRPRDSRGGALVPAGFRRASP